jgi:hypothetical protein
VKIAIAALASVAAVAAFIVVILWPRPPLHVHLLLVHAGYETNLAVPHNAAGRQATADLERWAHETNAHQNGHGGLIDVHREELLRDGDAVAEGLRGCRAPTLVVFLAAHGGDGENGPFLFRHDADLKDDTSFYRLDHVLEELARLPAATKKLLLVDATQSEAHLPSGQLYNGFIRSLKSHRDRIHEVPNLVVICSSDEDQHSWVAPEWRRSAFAHFVLQGLRGAADRPEAGNRNGRVDALELFHYTKDRVARWARHNRAAVQTPILIGDEKVAARLEIVPAESGDEDEVPPLAESLDGIKEIREVWTECERLRQSVPSPAAYAPDLWRKYLDAALRHEQLLRAGDAEHAGQLRKLLGELGQAITRRGIPEQLPSSLLTLAMPPTFGVSLSAAEAEKVSALWKDVKPEEAEGKLAALDKGASAGRKSLLRLAVMEAILREAEKNPAKLSESCRFLAAANEHALPLPVEAHFLAMLHPLADRGGTSRVAALLAREPKLVRRALEVRRLAEQAALGLAPEPGEEESQPETEEQRRVRREERTALGLTTEARESTYLPAYSEQVVPHIRSVIEEADARRRRAEDLLFTSDGDRWAEAGRLLDEAATRYQQAQQQAVSLRRALMAQHIALVELPFYTRCGLVREETLASAWERTHALVRKSAEAEGGLDAASGELLRALAKVRSEVDAYAGRAFAQTQHAWHDIEDLFQVPFLAAGQRANLVEQSRRLSHRLNAETAQATEAGGVRSEENAAVLRRARLALAVLGPDWVASHREDAEEVRRAGPGDRHSRLGRVGAALGRTLQLLPERVQEVTDRAARETPDEAARSLDEAVHDARRLEGAAVGAPRLTADPVGEQRRVLMHDLLCWQAERTFRDFWAAEKSDEDAEKPYYREAARLFLKDAESLILPAARALEGREREARLGSIERLRGLLDRDLHRRLVLRWQEGDAKPHRGDAEVNLADEAILQRSYLFDSATGMPSGEPVVWAEYETGLVGKEQEKQHRTRGGFGKPMPFPIVPQREAGGTARQTVWGLFRGHAARVVTTVHFHGEPDLIVEQPPTPPRGRIGMQTRVAEAGNTALALVLDCSGSMAFPVKDSKQTRFEKLTAALFDVMASVPEGVPVSLRAFGGFGNASGSETRLVWGPRPWRRAALGNGTAKPVTLDELRQEVGRLAAQLSGGTPLARAVWEARDDFPKDFDGFRTVVVLTDGVESGFAEDGALPKKAGDTPGRFLTRELADSGVVVNVIGFALEELKTEERDLQKEFVEAISTLGGSYEDVRSDRPLGSAIERAVRRMRFQVDADEGTAAPGELPKDPVDISSADEAADENWRWSPFLAAGRYAVRVRASRRAERPVLVNAGDSLLLDLFRTRDGRLALRRALYADSLQVQQHRHVSGRQRVPVRDGVEWLLAVHQNEPRDSELHLMATLERDEGPGTPRAALQQVRPRLAWFEVPAPGGGPVPMRVTALAGYPAPAWGIVLPRWPANTAPTLDAWWTEADLPPARTLKRGDDFVIGDPSSRIIDGVWAIDREKQASLLVESVELERRTFELSPGRREEVSCLVVRLSYDPKGEPYFVQAPPAVLGQEHRFYRRAGKYTGIYWPVSEDEVRGLTALHLVSVANLKQKGLRTRDFVLDKPDPNWRRPKAN